jgi:hypothetical protein
LIVAFGGSVAADLHAFGVRTVFDITGMANEPATRLMVLTKVWPDAVTANQLASATPELFQALLDMLYTDIDVRRLQMLGP